MESRERYTIEESLGELGVILEAVVERSAGEPATTVVSLKLYDDVQGSFYETDVQRHQLQRFSDELYALLDNIPLTHLLRSSILEGTPHYASGTPRKEPSTPFQK